MSRRPNLLFIISDQHSRHVLGSYGNDAVDTPNLDRLAERGRRFGNAYCNGPICVPSRASLATGRYVHELEIWDNALPYDGDPSSWMHALRDSGYRVVSIGKNHYRSADDDYGFTDERLPMHVTGGKGSLFTIIRDDPLPKASAFRRMIDEAGGGQSTYLDFDRAICREAEQWIGNEAAGDDRPWALIVSFVCPHPPFIAPPEYFARYEHKELPMPRAYSLEERPKHPSLEDLRRFFDIEDELGEEPLHRVIASYYGLVTFLDDNVGRVLAALSSAGLSDQTNVVYTSDHGESLGEKGLFSKCNMFEESVHVPLIMAGPDIPSGTVEEAPVSLVDLHPTFIELCHAGSPKDETRAGISLLQETLPADRPVFAEQHTAGVKSATYMVRVGDLKYIRQVGLRPMLFDLSRDPHELDDLAQHDHNEALVAKYEGYLRAILDPEATDFRAKANQQKRIVADGGREAILARGSTGFTAVPA